MSTKVEFWVPDGPAIIVSDGRGLMFTFADDDSPQPDVTGLAAAVLVTRLRWWADRIEATQGPS